MEKLFANKVLIPVLDENNFLIYLASSSLFWNYFIILEVQINKVVQKKN